jgi:hypothetical protein
MRHPFVLALAGVLISCGGGGEGAVPEGVALPQCDRQGDAPDCRRQVAVAFGYDGGPANSFQLAYRICYEGDFQETAREFAAGSEDPRIVAQNMATKLFNTDEAERAGHDGCLLAFEDLGLL